jgi:hypothetical protein
MPSTYADSVSLNMPQGLGQMQAGGRLVESSDIARSSRPGKVLAARQLEGGDLVITTDSHETGTLLEQKEEWTNVIREKTNIKCQEFKVIVH